ncbi:MAG: acetyl-CoA carboxylase, carboxyltransferase subunit beta [Eubacteriales bacterium]|jgi:acetyl-CoA carboxylase carboxyl transferase beta subunit|nr:acetyl-CoA carboxylase, carboxyltransferase subunit beta [Eubacteriales bacterium]
MNLKKLFKSHKNKLEGTTKSESALKIPAEHYISCTKCKNAILRKEIRNLLYVCPACNHHLRITARQRINITVDQDSFIEHDASLMPSNKINFPEYDEKLTIAAEKSGENEAVICGRCRIGGYSCAIFVMESNFMMGSMGTIVGEKITRLFEYSTENRLPVLGITVSGGARMQEGMLSLMQMAKVSGALKRHSDEGNLYITLITDPTSGGVTASFAMLADIIISEPDTLICFAGPRVIKQTIREDLPEGFQRAEFILETGFLDDIVERKDQIGYLTSILKIHSKGGAG